MQESWPHGREVAGILALPVKRLQESWPHGCEQQE